MSALVHRPLGSSGIQVSPLSLGSWQTYERIPRAAAAAVLARARELGIDLLEVARYNDQTGRAPIPTGYSEVVFGEAFRMAGWPRDEVVIAGKLWWEFWPRQSAADELDASLARTGLDRLDFIYSDPPPKELSMEEVVGAVGELVTSGRVRAWGIVNWPAERIALAGQVAARLGVPAPCAAQLAYNLAHRSPVEDADMAEALRSCGASVIASYVLAGGVLTGKYAVPGASGRMARALDDPRVRPALEAAARLRALADDVGATPAALAMAFALAKPNVASVLFGATSTEQVEENVRAVELLATLGPANLAQLELIGAGPDPG
jgi:aryl-alcohol dehydrogenase-like predicted oxidoreductase